MFSFFFFFPLCIPQKKEESCMQDSWTWKKHIIRVKCTVRGTKNPWSGGKLLDTSLST